LSPQDRDGEDVKIPSRGIARRAATNGKKTVVGGALFRVHVTVVSHFVSVSRSAGKTSCSMLRGRRSALNIRGTEPMNGSASLKIE